MTKNKVIIVDDDEDLQRLLAFSFKEKGYEPLCLTTGKEALSYLLKDENTQDAALLILDRILPDMEGLDILKQFKPKMPLLILSALSSEKDILAGLKVGAVDYISKPFSLPIFMQKAISLIER